MRQLIRLLHRTYMDTVVKVLCQHAKHVDLHTFPLSPRCLRAQRFRANGSHNSYLPDHEIGKRHPLLFHVYSDR